MRTTINIEDDVLEQARSIAARKGIAFRHVINEALRTGLAFAEKPSEGKPYRTKARDMGLRQGYDLDNIQELITQVEGEESR